MRRTRTVMARCLSPFCAGNVIEDSASEGHCGVCELRHRRRAGATGWGHLVGPLVVTLGGASHEVLEADAVRFREGYFTLDVTGGPIRVEPVARLVNLTTPPFSV
jgi:hypothetical protein